LQMMGKDRKLISMVQRILDRLGYHFTLYSCSERELYSLQSWKKEGNFAFLKEIKPCIKTIFQIRVLAGVLYTRNK
jgi:hypothetical protein